MANDDWFEGRRWSLFHADEEAMERCHRRRVGALVWLLFLVAAIAFGLAGCATLTPPQASKSAYDGPPMVLQAQNGDRIRLLKDACPNVSGWLAMSTAEMVYQGTKYLACWFGMGGNIIILDSNGDGTAIPAQAFQPETVL